MSRIILLIVSVFLTFSQQIFAQNSKWETLTDFKNVTAVATDPVTNVIYCASNGGMFSIDIATGKVLNKYTNLNGLVSNDVSALTIDFNRRIWIGATDGSISILNLANSTWKYIYDIKNSSEANKSINFLLPSGNFIFIATSYGIQKVSAVNFNFVDAPYYKLGIFAINTPVYSLTINSNIIYAATKSGVAYGNIATSNLNDPSSWENYSGSFMNADVRTIETFDNKIFAGSLTGFNYKDGSDWFPYPNPVVVNTNVKYIKAAGNRLYFISGDKIYYSLSENLNDITPYLSPNSYSVLGTYNVTSPVAGINGNGIVLSESSGFIFPNSPFTNVFNQITIDDNNTVWAAGGLPTNGFYSFDGTSWENYNLATHPEIGNSNWFQKIVSGFGNVWALGFGGGPTLLRGSEILNFNPSNSILPGISNNPNFCVPYGGAYDNSGVLWVTFFGTNSGNSLYAYFGDRVWFGYPNPSIITSATLSEVAIDSYQTKWIVSGGARSGVYFFNQNSTYTNTTDDVYGFYSNSDFGAEVTNVYDVIVDKNNEVWIATNNGIFIINNPLAAIQNPSQKPPALKLGIISGNLKVPFTENCITLTNDILNSKWVGTETNGVFHLSPDGSTLLGQFNTAKSPILSNQVKTIAVSNENGKAYFGTNNGLSAYQTDAIEPVADFDEIIVSPNPYLVPSDVNLKIDGLVENSSIKIISLSGDIVAEFESPGGRIAVWNGMNTQNQPAATGIYIIVAYNSDGSKVGKGKVAVVRK